MATLLELISLANDAYNDDPVSTYADGYYHCPASSAQTSSLLANWIGLPNKNETDDIGHCKKLTGVDSFFARLYGNIRTGEAVVAFRGTEMGKKTSITRFIEDVVTDIEIGAIGTISSQDIDALLFFQWAKNYLHNQSTTNFSRFPILTGHSLGGYLAQLIASKYPGTIAVTFNAPGLIGLVNPIMKINPAYARHDEEIASIAKILQASFSDKADKNVPLYKKDMYNFNISYDVIHKVGTQIGNSYILSGSNRNCNIKASILNINRVARCVISGHTIDEFFTSAQKNLDLANKQFSY